MPYLRVTLRKNRLINSLVQHLKKHEHAIYIDFQFHNFKFIQKNILDFYVPSATVDLCMKEVIDSLLRRKIMETLKALILTIIVLNLVGKDLFFTILPYLGDPL